ncbi:MAG: hypothetical protein H7287_07430 [Thermoleophilia bacterium]|nr:hypothetical protein [Thermoleophilia bacterium]
MTSPARTAQPTTRPDTVDSEAPRTWHAAGFALIRSEPEERTRLVSHVDRGKPAPWPAFVMVEVSELEAMAYRYDRAANDAGDTWHADEAEAWAYLGWEYEGLLSERFEIPDGVNADDYVLERAQRHVWKVEA